MPEKHQLEYLSALAEAGRNLHSALDPDGVLDRILELVGRVFSFDTCAILLWDPELGCMRIHQAIGYREDVVKTFRALPGEGVTGWVFENLKPLAVDDVSADDRYIQGVVDARSEIAAPLVIQGQVIGVLDAESTCSRTFTREEVEFFALFAQSAATAIHNARLYERLSRSNSDLDEKARRLRILNLVGKALNAIHDTDELLDEILRMANQALDFSACAVLLYDRHDQALKIRAARGYPEDTIQSFRVKPGEGITGRVMSTRTPALIPDVQKDPAYVPGIRDGRCEMVVPLMRGSACFGVLDAESPQPEGFTVDDLDLFATFAAHAAIALENARLYERTQQTYFETISSLAQALEARDSYTQGHSERVTTYAARVGEALGLDERQIELIRYAGQLHDIGKIGIRDDILNKETRLSEDDRRVIETHPSFADNILGPIRFLHRALIIVHHHHERWDGDGYPDGLAGEDIPLASRIIAVADTFDAMTSDRPYRKACTTEEAIKEIRRCSGSQFDPKIVSAFLSVVGEFKAA